jgi:hypothetical protein
LLILVCNGIQFSLNFVNLTLNLVTNLSLNLDLRSGVLKLSAALANVLLMSRSRFIFK